MNGKQKVREALWSSVDRVVGLEFFLIEAQAVVRDNPSHTNLEVMFDHGFEITGERDETDEELARRLQRDADLTTFVKKEMGIRRVGRDPMWEE